MAGVDQLDEAPPFDGMPLDDLAPAPAPAPAWSGWDAVDTWGAIGAAWTSNRTEAAMQGDNMRAFLTVIAWAEGTERAPDPYRVCYGYRHTIRDLGEHPAVLRADGTREWSGERLSDAMCRGAGLSPGCVSTAAGRYQLIRPTWVRCKRALRLPDFGPASQDAAAVYLIRERGAVDEVEAGRIEEAIRLCRTEWASLPGNSAGQPQRAMSELLAQFERAGGNLA